MNHIDWDDVRRQLDSFKDQLEHKASRELENWPELLERRARQLRARLPERQIETDAYLACITFGETLLLPIEDLRAIQGWGGCVALPLAPRELLGICNHRGKTLSILDLGLLLSLPGQTEAAGYLLFMRTNPLIGLRVDSLLGVIELESGISRRLVPAASPYLSGLTPQGQLVFDLIRLLQHPLFKGDVLSQRS